MIKLKPKINLRDQCFICEFGGKGRERLEKKRKEQVEEIEENGRGGLRGLTFLHNTKPSSFEGTKKLYLKGLYEFFKLNLCCYNIFKIKNIIIICINLSFSKKLFI